MPNLLWPFWGQPVHGSGPHVTDATRNFDRFYMKAETIKLYWNRPDFALDDHVWQQHVVVLSPSGGLWMRQHERGGCLWCEPYNCRHYIYIALYHPGSSDGLLTLCLCLSVCFCVLAIMTQCSNAKSQPQWNVWYPSIANHYSIAVCCLRCLLAGKEMCCSTAVLARSSPTSRPRRTSKCNHVTFLNVYI